MVRRTKQEALATRTSLLDAAERLFLCKGVSRTSLNDIALEAGATRGAIYWHFKDKADLFNAMMDRVTLPLEAGFEPVGLPGCDPLPLLRTGVLRALRRMAGDEQTRCVFEVATQKVEYVDELGAVRCRHIAVRQQFLDQMRKALRGSARFRGRPLPIPAAVAAFDLVRTGERTIDAYLAGLGLRT
jgi:TetR/AcrR family acrAB operon transcriptional repressor